MHRRASERGRFGAGQECEVYKKALTESPTYKAEMQKYGTGGHGGDPGTGGRGHSERDCQRCIAVSGAAGERRHATEG
ncbi:hypothetical protein [Pectobacterium versatile]|uniref:hypothetical protein n=1 Tax=Pectobacterium versatile TaxID=2488639 RepID=UPI002B25614B|nr:hypothetical protein [Pectobacterium versatile]